MRTVILTTILVLTVAGCAGTAPLTPSAQSAPSAPAPSAPPSASPTQPKESSPATEPAPAGLLVQMRAASHPGYDRLVFEFGGDKPPTHTLRYVDEVRQDPSDHLITLPGKRFLVVVFDGGTLDTARYELDPAKARRYTGPNRITPDLALLKEVVIAGDFEAVLSFGVGLSQPAETDVQVLTGPARLVIDFRG